jgi:hypothetical protein
VKRDGQRKTTISLEHSQTKQRQHMKVLSALTLSIWLVGTAVAQEMTEPNRVVGIRAVSLQPLFDWWTQVASLSASNASLPPEERLPIPDRPLKHWVRLTTLAVTNTGFAHLATVQIQHVPDGLQTNQTVVLRHGPFVEKKKVDDAAQETADLVKSQKYQLEQAEYYESRAEALKARAYLYHEMYAAGGSYVHSRLADDYYAAAARARRQANLARDRASNIESRLLHLDKITQGQTTFVIDNFAMATGEIYQGLPVYSLGLRYGR